MENVQLMVRSIYPWNVSEIIATGAVSSFLRSFRSGKPFLFRARQKLVICRSYLSVFSGELGVIPQMSCVA